MLVTSSLDPQAVKKKLGRALRDARLANNKTLAQVAGAIDVSPPTVSRIELARLTPSEQHVRKIAEYLDLDPDHAQTLLRDARHLTPTAVAATKLSPQQTSERLSEWVTHLDQTAEIKWFEGGMVPGLLHTPEYSRAIAEAISILNEGNIAIDTDAYVVSRARHSAALLHKNKRFIFTLRQSALEARFGDETTMARQYEHLIAVARNRDNVTIQIIPNDAFLPTYAIHDFLIMDNQVAIVETYTSDVVVDDQDHVSVYARAFDLLSRASIAGDPAITLLTGLRDSLAPMEPMSHAAPATT